MPNLGATELIIIAVVLVLLFGAKKLPDAARSIGRSMRIFKSEVKEMGNDDQPQNQQPQQGQLAPGQQGYWDQPQNQPNPQYHSPQQPQAGSTPAGQQPPQPGYPQPQQPGNPPAGYQQPGNPQGYQGPQQPNQ
ncbi:Sec-independent protein translocase subunit TatA [Corynebacterium suedekumii]|nr:Sec-independent protein translocase subunit TatA [Corynebacterium suedekumii]